ncbi:MAG: NYN domain-containing protein [Rhodocyclaceae bacterium]
MKSALFVDFDNVYSGLKKLDPAMADQFALRPQQWMQWLVESLAPPEHAPPDARRRVLVRRCYLNPQAYQRFRPSFNLAGFEIIDCPALTGEGKTSTDIHMVLDIIDLLQHEAHYDEFIVFSADADFTPVLRKLRRWDRRTTVLAVGFPSAAYRASADLLIDPDAFVRDALGFEDADDAAPDAENAPAANASTAAAGHSATSTSASAAAHLPSAPPASPPEHSPQTELRRIIATIIRDEVARASMPVACPRIAQLLSARDDTLEENWHGAGTFRRFLEGLDLGPLRIDWSSGGGRIYDPARHSPTAGKPNWRHTLAASDWGTDADLQQVASQIHDVIGAPLLSPQAYQALFRTTAADLAERPFDLNETGKRVRDAMLEAGHPVSRADVNWILRGLLLRGHKYGSGQDDPPELARKTANNVRSLCLREAIVIDTEMDAAINRWIAG